MLKGKSLQELAIELDRQKEAKRDLVVDTRHLSLSEDGKRLTVLSEEPVALPFVQNDGLPLERALGPAVEEYSVNHHAHHQIAQRIGIPLRYYDRMANEAPELLQKNVNHWFEHNPESRMVRTLDGTARAFLSDRYQRIDNYDVAHVVVPIFMELASDQGLEVVSCEVTERKMYMKAVSPKVAGEVKVGDYVQAGVSVSNSEIGLGAFVVTPLVYRLVCLNGMTVNDGRLRKHHVGARADVGEDGYRYLSDETIAADDKALMLKARDIVRGALSQENFDQILSRMQETTERRIEGSPAKAVEVLGKTLGLTGGEESDVMRHLIEGGDLSQWGVLNAVTATANTMTDYDRASEFEQMGGKVLDLPATQWREIAMAA